MLEKIFYVHSDSPPNFVDDRQRREFALYAKSDYHLASEERWGWVGGIYVAAPYKNKT